MLRQNAVAGVLALLTACTNIGAPNRVPSPVVTNALNLQQARTATPTPNPTKGQLAVALVIDQFPAWIARERLTLLPESGGFARLRKEGTWYRDMRYAHAITETAPGHASLYSGKTPREHGIIANELLVDGHATGILVDRTSYIVTGDGVRPELGSSGAALKTEVLGDRYKAKFPHGRLYSFSLKDRGAIFGGGRHADLVLWYDAALGQFVSSTAFTKILPSWVLPLVNQQAVQARLAQPWNLLDAAWVAKNALTKDEQAGEGDLANYGTIFAHFASDSAKPNVAFRANPASDRLLLELGLLAIDNSPREERVFLAISLSANDYIGHVFGPDSWEAWDELMRLDAALGWFFSELDSRRGAASWSVALTGDHGVAPLPEVSRATAKQYRKPATPGLRPDHETERLFASTLAKIAEDAGAKALGSAGWVAGLVDPYLYLTSRAKGLTAAQRAKLRKAITMALQNTRGVAKLFDMSELGADCPPHSDESTDALVCRSVQPGSGGDYFVELNPGYFFDASYVPGFGTSHGNASLYDRSVPLLVRTPGQLEPGKVVDSQQSFEAFSQALGQQLKLD